MFARLTVILNPVAGNGFAERRIPEITARLDAHDIPYELRLTEYPGHARTLAAEVMAASDADTVVLAAGGDGTITEVINGLMETKGDRTPVLGIIPIGRGNDFAFSASLPHDLTRSLDIICEGYHRPIDIGNVKGGDYREGRWFGNGIGIGFDTIVGLEAAKMKHFHGAAGYAIGALKTIITYPKAPDLEITYGETVKRLSPALVSIMNGRRMGGAFFMAPDGCMDDGLFNICMTLQGRRLRLLRDMGHYLKGTQAGLDDTFTDLAPSYSIRALKGGMAVHADGETICISGYSLVVTCHPGAIHLLSERPGT